MFVGRQEAVGSLSRAFHEEDAYGHQVFLDDPDLILQDGFTLAASALWRYMALDGANPNPTLHEIATGFALEVTSGIDRGITDDFASSIKATN
jgi:hypothetical protein